MKRILSHRSFFFGILALLGIFLILLFPKIAVGSAAAAANTWFSAILPTLLPFAVLSGILVKSSVSRRLSRVFAPISGLFGFSDSFAFVWLISLLSGYPVGARLTATLFSQKQLSESEAALMINAASTSGPGFLMSAVAVQMLGAAKYGLPLLVAHFLSALLIAKLNGNIPHRHMRTATSQASASIGVVFLQAMTDALSGMLIVLGAMVLFGSFAGILGKLTNGILAIILTGFLEFSSGCLVASTLPIFAALPLISFFCGFGGVSVILQTAAICASCGIPLRNFLQSKFLQGTLAALFGVIFCPTVIGFAVCCTAVLLAALLFYGKSATQKPCEDFPHG